MREGLKPCPFCDSDLVLEVGPDSPGRDIYCAGCKATVFWSDSGKHRAAEFYNRRAECQACAEKDAELSRLRSIERAANRALDLLSVGADEEDNEACRVLRLALSAPSSISKPSAEEKKAGENQAGGSR